MITCEQAREIMALESKYPRHPMGKFCRHPRVWYDEAMGIARDMGLHESEPLRILDIGCGFGYFARACCDLGHHVLGLDTLNTMIYLATRALAIDLVSGGVEAYETLENVSQYHLITTFGVNFRYGKGRYWGTDEYRFLAKDLRSHIIHGGRWVLRPNQTDDKTSPIARLMEADWWRTVVGPNATITIKPLEVTIQWPND
jgi:SAM-dependent methyltransferase